MTKTHCWQHLLLLSTTFSLMMSFSSCFQPSSSSYAHIPSRHCSTTTTTTSLNYASSTAGPMSQVDPNARTGGCPFLVTSLDTQTTYSVPALFSGGDDRPIILFDGSCNLCNGFVQFLLKFDKAGNLRFAALQSRVGELILQRMSEEVRNEVLHSTNNDSHNNNQDDGTESEERYKSLVYATSTSTYIQSSAVLQILSSLSSPQNTSKRIRALQYLGLAAYVVPTKVRDKVYKYVSKRRKKWFGVADECWLYDEGFEGRFVDDGVLTGVFQNDQDGSTSQDINVAPIVSNLFQGDNPPQRGDRVKIIWPQHTSQDPSVTYDDEFPNGLCLVGATGTITTVDLPMRIVMRVDRSSLGLEKDSMGQETMIAWVKPEEVALVEHDECFLSRQEKCFKS